MHCNDSPPLYSFNYYSKPGVIQADGTYYQISEADRALIDQSLQSSTH